MNTDQTTYKFENTTRIVIGAFYEIYNALGPGFLEKVYENALMIELKERGLRAQHQCPIKVHHKGECVGDYIADILVEDKIICEIKAVQQLRPEHEAQLLNYLKATRIKVGLLLNFGPKPEIMRRIF